MAQSNNISGGKSGGLRVADDDHYATPSSSRDSGEYKPPRQTEAQVQAAIKRSKEQGWSELAERGPVVRGYKPPVQTEAQVQAAIKRSKEQGWSELAERGPVVRGYKPPVQTEAQVQAAIQRSKEQGWSELAERGPIVRGYKPPVQTEAQVQAAIKKSKEQGWSELAERGPIVTAASSRARAEWNELKKTNPSFLDVGQDVLKLGRLVAEEGKSKIYEASLGDEDYSKVVAKVFRVDGFSLVDFQGHSTTKKSTFGSRVFKSCNQLHLGTFLKDGRFAFIIPRFWGDLRKLIDVRMSAKDFQGPPFSFPQALWVMSRIATRLRELHARDALHKDLKAANVMFFEFGGEFGNHFFVEGLETSLGLVQGNGLWRAPELLELELLKKNHKEMWTPEADSYSFAMTCYEVLTGNIPFFGYDERDWKRVIDGERPHLPNYVNPKAQDIVEQCWHKEPSKRLTFEEILAMLENLMKPFNKDKFIIEVLP